MLALVIMASCSGKGNLEKMLQTVPADATFVAIGDARQASEQLKLQTKEGELTARPELQEILDKFVDKEARVLLGAVYENTDIQVVTFMQGQELYVTFTIKDEKALKEAVEKAAKAKFTEEDGFQVLEKQLYIKGKQGWVSMNPSSAKTIAGFADLKKDDSFAAKYKKALPMLTADQAGMFISVDSLSKFMQMAGEAEAGAMLQMGMAHIYKDPQYIVVNGHVDGNGLEAAMKVLDEDMTPAEFLFPMGKIDTSAMNHVNNDAAVTGAVALTPKMMKTLSTMLAGLGAGDAKVMEIIETLDGTAAFSYDGDEKVLASLGFASKADAEKAITAMGPLAQGKNKATVDGKYLLIGGDDKASGKGAKELSGAYIGFSVNFDSPFMEKAIGQKLPDMGKLFYTFRPDGKSAELKITWKIKDFYGKVIELAKIAGQPTPAKFSAPAVMDEPEDFTEPEPDNEEGNDIGW